FWRRISPRRAIADFAHEWQQPNPYRWRILGVSVAATFALMMMLIPESERVEPQPPEVTWITTFAPDRTEAEIVASNLANQRRKEELEAQAEARAERRREFARTLGKATGLDVDALEKQYGDESDSADAAPAPDTAESARTAGER